MKDFLKTNVGKTLITAAYIATSAVISYLITATAGDAQLFGPLTVIVNIGLVFIQKTWFSSNTPNIGG